MCTSHRRSGTTLIELLVSVGASAMLVSGLIGTVVLATHALPEKTEDVDDLIDASAVAEQIAGELQCALMIVEASPNAVQFTVPDRDGDAAPDMIRYAWTGVVGTPLMRQQNARTAVAVVEDVRQFALGYDTRVHDEPGDPIENESGEQQLSSCMSGSSGSDYEIKELQWAGNVVRPALPAEAVKYKVKSLTMLMHSQGMTTGEFAIVLYKADASGHPSGAPLARLTRAENSLTSWYLSTTFTFNDAPLLMADERFVFMVEHMAGIEACTVYYANGGLSDSNIAMVETRDKGSTWQVYNDKSVLFVMRGTIITEGDPMDVIVTNVMTTHLDLALGRDQGPELTTAVRLLNQPEITP